MAIPVAQLQNAKDLLLLDQADTFLDVVLSGEWDAQVEILARTYDLFAEVATLTAVTGQAIYSVPAGTMRLLSVLHRGRALGFTDRMTLDLRDPDWESALPGVPRFWAYNALPGEVDTPPVTITPREFLLTPSPDGANAGAGALTLILERTPAAVPLWVEPILLYLTVAQVADTDQSLRQPEKAAWFRTLAEAWLQTARKTMQI